MAGGGGGFCGGADGSGAAGEPVATPGEFAGPAAAWYLRIVLRSMPVMRAISRWLAPLASSVWMVVFLFGFKTFNSSTSSLGEVSSRPVQRGPAVPAYNPLPINSGGGV